MTTLTSWLPNRASWLLAPSHFANVLIAGAAALYLQLVLADQLSLSFWVCAVVALATWLLATELLLARRLPTLRALSLGELSASPAARLTAIAEAQGLPDTAGQLSAGLWLGGTVLLALILSGVSALSGHAATRLLLAGALFAPIAGMQVSLLTALRTRAAIEALAEGLPHCPAPRASAQHKTRFRMVMFTLTMAATPALMLADVGRAATNAIAAHDVSAPAGPLQLGVSLVILAGVFVALAMLAAWAGGSGIADPLRRVADEATALSRGELGKVSVIAGDAEVGQVTSVFAPMKQRLVEVIGQLHAAGARIDTATATLRVTARRYETGSTEQATALSETSTTTESLARNARQISQNASQVQTLAQQPLEAADSGRARAETFQSSVERMKQDNRSIASAVERLQARVQQIGSIVEFINGVADRSDLLALSAELEGTRSGEVGRGFTLVAGEMRRLAENVLESTAEVQELIGEIREATRQTAQATEASASLTHGSTSQASEVARSLTTVAELARQTSNAVRAISLATQQQQTGTDQLAEAMVDILGLTHQGLATTQQLTVANEQLRALSMNLSSVVDRFA